MSELQALLSWSVYGIPAFLFLITVVVFFHELGHFSVARLFNVRIETFSIGFGRPIVSWKDRKGTQWKISWLPLGGFVKFFGDADGASTPDREAAARMSPEDRAVAFPFKPLWQRALIVVAGPLANFVLAVVILTGLFLFHGKVVIPPVAGDVAPHGAGARAGIVSGDRIVAIDGADVQSFSDFAQIVALSAGQTLPIVIDRDGRRLTVLATPQDTAITDDFGNRQRIGDLGIAPLAPPVVDSVLPGKPAQRAGIRPQDRIVSIDGHATANMEAVQRLVSTNPGKNLRIVVQRGDALVSIDCSPYRNKDGKGLLGLAFAVPRTVTHLGPIASVGAAFGEIGDIISVTFRARTQLFRGNTSQLAGPVGILKLSGQVAAVSFIALVHLIALLSVSIGLVNLFPIPLLDGGHLLYYACEGVLGRPLGERAQDVGFRLGLAVVAGIFLLATWNDLLNLF
ncbi:MAG: RIP metalloprotease RseP [Rhizomicrobium sp.]